MSAGAYDEGRPYRPVPAGGLLRAATEAIPPSGLVLLAIFSVQAGAGLAKNLFAELPPGGVVFIRIVAAGIAMILWVRPSLRGHSWADLGVAAAFGVALAVMNYSIYQAIARIPLGTAVAIEFLGPLAIAIAASRRRLDLLWVALAGGGVVLLLAPWEEAGGQDVIGVIFALCAAAGWATYILLSAATGRRFSGSSGLAIAMVVSIIVIAPAGIAEGGPALLDPRLLLIGAGVGLLSSAIPYAIELEALRRMPQRVFGIFMSLEPAVAALIGLVILGEILNAREWAAIGCVIVASAGSARSQA